MNGKYRQLHVYFKQMQNFINNVSIQYFASAHTTFYADWQVRNVCSPFTRLYYIDRGSGSIRHHDRMFPIRAGNLYLIPEQTLSDYSGDQPIDIRFLHFSARVIDSIDLFEVMQCPYQLSLDHHLIPAYKDSFDRIINLNAPGSAAQSFLRDALIRQLLFPLLNATHPPPTLSNEKFSIMHPIVEYIDKHLHAKLTTQQLARQANMHPATFVRHFKTTFNTTPIQYVQHRRIEKVRQLMLAGDSLETIAEQTGFCDAFHLSKTFKRLTGITPRQYRNTPHTFPLESKN